MKIHEVIEKQMSTYINHELIYSATKSLPS